MNKPKKRRKKKKRKKARERTGPLSQWRWLYSFSVTLLSPCRHASRRNSTEEQNVLGKAKDKKQSTRNCFQPKQRRPFFCGLQRYWTPTVPELRMIVIFTLTATAGSCTTERGFQYAEEYTHFRKKTKKQTLAYLYVWILKIRITHFTCWCLIIYIHILVGDDCVQINNLNYPSEVCTGASQLVIEKLTLFFFQLRML